MKQNIQDTPIVVVSKNDKYVVCSPQYGISIVCDNLEEGYRKVVEKREEVLAQMTELGLEEYIDPAPLNIHLGFSPKWKKILTYFACVGLIILCLVWVKNGIVAFKKNIISPISDAYDLSGEDGFKDRARKLGIFIAPYYSEIRKLVTDEEYLNQAIEAHNAKVNKSKKRAEELKNLSK